MAQADLAIGAGGSATWERCCLGLPTLTLVTADNQRRLAHDLCEAGYVLCPAAESGEESARQLRALLAAMLSSDSLLRGLAARCAALVDGLGAERVAAVIRSAGLQIRRATEADRERVYEWRNHPTVRGYSRQSAPLAPESHARWYAAALRDPDRALLIAEADGVPIAVVRFDINADSCDVSVYLAPGHQAGGWGSEVLRRAEEWLRRSRPQVTRYVAEVLPGNRASLGAFLRAGYREHGTVLVKSAAEGSQPQPTEP
jgi:RimJ/RimL family protein N-acetyltransferase